VGAGCLSAPNRVLPPGDSRIAGQQLRLAGLGKRVVAVLGHVVISPVSEKLCHRPEHGCRARCELEPAARVARLLAAPAGREQGGKVRSRRVFKAARIHFDHPVGTPYDLSAGYALKQTADVDEPACCGDCVTLDLSLIRLTLTLSGELATVEVY
jgi:hypothetical protein